MFTKLRKIKLSGKDVYPIIEGGKGVGVSNGASSGSFAAADAVGTFSGVNCAVLDEKGRAIPLVYRGKTRLERHEELIQYSIEGAIHQARVAHEVSQGKGRIHVNVLWEMAAAERVLHGLLSKAKDIVHGITCGAGMPYKVAEIAEKYNQYYYPIISSMRAFRALWKRSYHKHKENLGGVVYEDPWKAGGHNGLSNAENPKEPQDPYPRVAEIRKYMNDVGLQDTPIVMAGGIWNLAEFEHWVDNDEIGPIAFQLGTRPIFTKENTVPQSWKDKLQTLKEDEVYLNRYSPTGFYSSAVENDFIKELQGREKRQIEISNVECEKFDAIYEYGPRKRKIFVTKNDLARIKDWVHQGYTEMMKTPDNTAIFVDKERSDKIRYDQVNCMGCLSACRFSNWYLNPEKNYTIGKLPDPRSFCIQKTLQNIVEGGDVDNELMFAGHNAFRFQSDKMYNNDYIPTTKELVDKLISGE